MVDAAIYCNPKGDPNFNRGHLRAMQHSVAENDYIKAFFKICLSLHLSLCHCNINLYLLLATIWLGC